MPTDIKVILRESGILETSGTLDERTASTGTIDIKSNGDIHNELIEEPLAAQEMKAYSGSKTIIVKEFIEDAVFIPVDPEGTPIGQTEESVTFGWTESEDPDFISYVIVQSEDPF